MITIQFLINNKKLSTNVQCYNKIILSEYLNIKNNVIVLDCYVTYSRVNIVLGKC